MLTIDNKIYRNLQEQVEANKLSIQLILEEKGILNQFGIRVIGKVDYVRELPEQDNLVHLEYGDAYAVGTETPYDLFIWTRKMTTTAADFWFNIGKFPQPSTVPGPVGPQGPAGKDGESSKWYISLSAPSFTAVNNDLCLNVNNGDVYAYEDGWVLKGSIKGPQGIQGLKGNDSTVPGPVGPQGPKGEPGANTTWYLLGELTSVSQLPDPTNIRRDAAYLVKVGEVNHIYAIAGTDNLTWVDVGAAAYGPEGPAGKDGVGVDSITYQRLTNDYVSLTYDTTNGISIESEGEIEYSVNNENKVVPINYQYKIPLIPGDNITIDKADGVDAIIIKSAGGEVVQSTGTSTTAIMSQKAVTDELDNKINVSTASQTFLNRTFNVAAGQGEVVTDSTQVTTEQKVNDITTNKINSFETRVGNQFIPAGGQAGQFLKKIGVNDYEVGWATVSGGGSGGSSYVLNVSGEGTATAGNLKAAQAASVAGQAVVINMEGILTASLASIVLTSDDGEGNIEYCVTFFAVMQDSETRESITLKFQASFSTGMPDAEEILFEQEVFGQLAKFSATFTSTSSIESMQGLNKILTKGKSVSACLFVPTQSNLTTVPMSISTITATFDGTTYTEIKVAGTYLTENGYVVQEVEHKYNATTNEVVAYTNTKITTTVGDTVTATYTQDASPLRILVEYWNEEELNV